MQSEMNVETKKLGNRNQTFLYIHLKIGCFTMQKEDKKEVLPTIQDYKGKDVLRVKEFIYRKSS